MDTDGFIVQIKRNYIDKDVAYFKVVIEQAIA